jgi:hypothetical protein
MANVKETLDNLAENIFESGKSQGASRELLEPIFDQIENLIDPVESVIDAVKSAASLVGLDFD